MAWLTVKKMTNVQLCGQNTVCRVSKLMTFAEMMLCIELVSLNMG